MNGTATNYGVVLWATNETTDGYDLRFYSSEYTTDPTLQPKLEITYSTEAATKTVYFLKDHLGSVRATVLDSAGAPMIGYDDYDPWGYPLARRTNKTPYDSLQKIAKNKFTGKEWDDEFGVNWYDSPFRDYDPQIGRWMSVDPLAEKFPSLTPYHYGANNPALFIDINGDSIDVSQLKQSQQNTLLIQLMQLTGLALSVNKAGKIVIVEGLRGIGPGSQTAREYITGLIGFTADQHQSGQHLTVQAGAESRFVTGKGQNNVIELSFDPRKANNVDPLAFSPGTTFFHESHHFSDYFKFGTPLYGTGGQDPIKGSVEFNRGDTGPTVDFVNQIRSEMGLPLRATYKGFQISGTNYLPFGQTSKQALLRGIVPASNTKYFWWK